MGIMREIWMPLLQKYQISCLLSFWQIGIEQNRCAMACQGYGAVFLYTLIKKQWKPSPTSSILQTGIVTPK